MILISALDSVLNSASETVCYSNDDSKLIDKLRFQINIIIFVMYEYCKTC